MFASSHHAAYLGLLTPSLPPTIQRSTSGTVYSNMSTQRASVTKARSSGSLRSLAAVAARESRAEAEASFHTIRDPRMASSSDLSRTSTSSRGNETKDEISVLSEKLVSAINHQQTLDDNLAQARHELETSRAQQAQLEDKIKEYESRITSGELMTRENSQKRSQQMADEVEQANRARDQMAQAKRKIEGELEDLTASLFDEANKQVAVERELRDTTEKKNQQLRDQIRDGEAVIASQIEQLAELKSLMVSSIGTDHRKELSESPTVSDAPASPMTSRGDSLIRLLEAMNLSPVTPDHPAILPSPSTQLTHLIRPRCRTDIPAYDDFKYMLSTSAPRSHTPSHAASRAGSGSYSTLTGLGLGGLAHSNSSNPNLSVSATKTGTSTALPGSFSPAPDAKGPAPLKETRFFKRIMQEDVEPTLRLDLSPSLSWLQKRAILSAVTDSTLIVEPIPDASQKLYGKYTACTLCGEHRKADENPRTHAMRTKEGEGANKWSICTLCLEKIRAVGDMIGYVRMVRDGVVKIADLKDEEEAWEEIIKLRERLFWARMAGGVVPAFVPTATNTPAPQQMTLSTQVANGDRTPGFITPSQSRRASEEEISKTNDVGKENRPNPNQTPPTILNNQIDEKLTTFANAREKMASVRRSDSPAPPSPVTPHRKRESGGGSNSSFPKISIPKMPQLPSSFWSEQVNTLH